MSLPRHESPHRISPSCLFAVMVMAFFAVFLGGVRLYSLYLEYRLSDINSKIEFEMSRKVQLEIKMASMLSPERIYVNAKNKFGMKPRSSFQTIRIAGGAGESWVAGKGLQDSLDTREGKTARRPIVPPALFDMAGAAHAKE
ncbi:hypothetical protein TheveDRAFT_0857 [Thermanaerovibrio velox DSM 12556]|uniref:Cell division protein FtsL n=1 Tax=Thermanaerovibrio velox DSM 12556 TaxID=926567 RepID=H0URQ5_9BACT|nr:hypothetical protein [Thermanaerovibrio velox]EHM09994.1 hypothetical protein TheveDRAFT_0857 [Thermanaerovibrio velox DSM 12556]